MFVFQEIWWVLFSCNTRFEICPLQLTDEILLYLPVSHTAFTLSKSTMEILEQSVKSVQSKQSVHLKSFWCLYC